MDAFPFEQKRRERERWKPLLKIERKFSVERCTLHALPLCRHFVLHVMCDATREKCGACALEYAGYGEKNSDEKRKKVQKVSKQKE